MNKYVDITLSLIFIMLIIITFWFCHQVIDNFTNLERIQIDNFIIGE